MNLKNPLSWLSVGFGSGLSPIAPGTIGSFLALIIYYYLFFGNIVEVVDHLIFLIFLLITFFKFNVTTRYCLQVLRSRVE